MRDKSKASGTKSEAPEATKEAEPLQKAKAFAIGLLRDIAVAVLIVAVIASIGYALTGTWRIAFAVESESMLPHIHVGDLVFVQAPSRTEIITKEEGKEVGYKSFGDYGDVIIYRPNGLSSVSPIIHRAIRWVEAGEPMWESGPPAPHAGYITKGDNNPTYDQALLKLEPVRPEWVIGVAKFRIPYVGYARLIFEFVFVPFCGELHG